jgi:septal ring factor EnvC (AmiA/AmiB activator)
MGERIEPAELTALRGEAKALLIANENTERACAALRDELRKLRAQLAEQAAETAQAKDRAAQAQTELAGMAARLADTEARIAGILASHSWRITAPIRKLRLTVSRHP